ncbi:nuclear hormone receptor HR96 isoform X2 [Zootermopsis nevadensis]|uniref:Nuclear hormone receptor HR96 n=1 Tax=Zootermopsis nevadensis TaxID=136037 RepID=A0A067QP68_ZOONE|nr:nuclear hormone receptor HR96 isoform X2 [Zootermopsis nevadensis]KDR10212.1 Nuclear hormone receptor HR96 [Zootermopsis nevadensis]
MLSSRIEKSLMIMDADVKSPAPDIPGLKGDPKICGVCGDRALGYNFNAVTCESCKAFFRRNALKNKEFRCPFTESCDITIVTRRFCQRCRLQKCLAIGMRKDYIMSEEDKVMKRQKIELNRAKKRPLSDRENHSKLKRELLDDTLESVADPGLSVSSVSSCPDQDRLSAPEVSKAWIADDARQPDQNFEDLYRLHTISPRASTSTDRHQMSEPFPSPTSAASIPSPSSPPDSATVAASKTLEMLSENTNKHICAVSVITSPVLPSQVLSHPCMSDQDGSVMQRSILHHTSREAHIPESNDTPLLSSLISSAKTDEMSPETYIMSSSQPAPVVSVIKKEVSASQNVSSWNSRRRNDMITSTDSQWNGMAHNNLRENAAKEILQDVQRIPIAPNSIESILSEAIKLEFEAYSSLAKSHQNSRELNDAERAKLNELIVANKALHEPLDDDLSTLVGDDTRFKTNAEHSPMLLDVINLTAIAIRRLIKTSKKINAFKNMCQEDQVALLKGGCTEILILRSAMTYDPDTDLWKIPHTQEYLNVKVDVLKEASGNIYEEHQRFLRTFDPRWRTDENIMLILSAITLFTPDRPRVVHHDVIKLEQNSYYYLLRRYLESIYPGCEARSVFLKLIQKISELHRLNDDHVRVYLDVNPKDVEPLLIEIFDLKPH